MPRKRDKEKAIKNGSDIPMTAEGYRNYEREKAQKALKTAKKVEAKKIKEGHRWCSYGKTRRLVKPKN